MSSFKTNPLALYGNQRLIQSFYNTVADPINYVKMIRLKGLPLNILVRIVTEIDH